MDEKKKLFAIRMVTDGALEAYDHVSLIDDMYDRNHLGQIFGGNEIIGVKEDVPSILFLCDEMERV